MGQSNSRSSISSTSSASPNSITALERRPLEHWTEYFENNGDAEKLLQVLLSDTFTMDEKFDLMRLASRHMKGLGVKSKFMEDKLKSTKLAQYWRYVLYCQTGRKMWESCQANFETSFECRWVVQREIYVQGKVDSLQKSDHSPLSSDEEVPEAKQLKAYEKELKHLNKRYLALQWKLWVLSNDLDSVDGPLKRAINTRDKNPRWYLADWLKQDCARRGGCCGRDCGCCERPWYTDRERNRGHCTTACGCCIKSNNGDAESDTMKDLEMFPIKFDPKTLSKYANRFLLNYFFAWES